MRRLGILWLLLALLGAGCTHPVHIKNARPRVSHIGPVQPGAITPAGQDVIEIVLYVQDHERDPVDVRLEFAGDDGVFRPIAQAPGGHNLVGLASARDYPGQAHVIYWDPADADPPVPDSVVLRAVPVDLPAGEGTACLTPAFAPTEGLPADAACVPGS